MKALHFGAGNIGRGFIGKLLSDAGIHVTFADIDTALVTELQKRQSYPVKLVGEDCKVEMVGPVSAIHSQDPHLIDLIAEVDLITTAVGPNVLRFIANDLAKGIALRYQNKVTTPLNIIACENMVRGTSQLKIAVMTHLPEAMHDFVTQHIGFIDSAVDRIVPPAEDKTDPLAVTVETFCEWIVDESQFIGAIPPIAGMECTSQLMAFVERKLFTLNTGHCITAYIGNLRGFLTIKQAIADKAIHQLVKQAMQESGEVLIQRYHFDRAQHAAYIEKILTRFANPYLTDEVDRVARQPIRKLSPNDRLIRPLLGTIEYQLNNNALLQGIAAALKYNNPSDPQSVELQTSLNDKGVIETLNHYCQLAKDSAEVTQIVRYYDTLN